jgi:hypothetical protein
VASHLCHHLVGSAIIQADDLVLPYRVQEETGRGKGGKQGLEVWRNWVTTGFTLGQ